MRRQTIRVTPDREPYDVTTRFAAPTVNVRTQPALVLIRQALLAYGLLAFGPTHAGIPVLDIGNLTQNIVTAIEAAAQTAKQMEQYRTQLKQYENMLQNSLAPAAFIWDQAQSTITALVGQIDTIKHYKNQTGNLENYLAKFKDLAYYRSSPCFNGSGGCTPAERTAMAENRRLASEAQKKANDAVFRGLDYQQTALQSDARNLQRLQGQAQSAQGQMQAISYANQLASHQSNQLLQIRALLVAQQSAMATQSSSEASEVAEQKAAREYFYQGLMQPVDRSKNRTFKP